MKRRTLGALAAAAGVGALGACAKKADSGSGDTGVVDMTMTTWSSDPTLLKTWNGAADEFRKTHPRLGKFTIQQMPFDQYDAQLTIQLSGSKPPDLGFIQAQDTTAWHDAGVLYDIRSMKDDPDAAWSDVLPASYQYTTDDSGALWSFPTVSAAHVMYYNKTAFDKAKVDSPDELFAKDAWTWENLRRVSKELVESGVVKYGYDIQQFTTGLPGYIDRGFGAHYWPNGDTCGLTDPKSVAAIQFIHDMRFVDNSMAHPGSTANFPTGDTGITVGSTSFMGQLSDSSFDWSIMPQPKGDVPYNPGLAQAFFSVFANGQDPKLATELLMAIVSADTMNKLDGLLIGPRKAQLAEIPAVINKAHPNVTVADAKRAAVDPQSSATADPPLVNSVQVNTVIKPIIEGLWTADADIAKVLAAASAAATPLLKA